MQLASNPPSFLKSALVGTDNGHGESKLFMVELVDSEQPKL
jgi:hypothetical protein